MAPASTSHEALLDVIRRVRNRWRAKAALQGAGMFLGAALLLAVLSAWSMDWFRFSAGTLGEKKLRAWTFSFRRYS